MPADIEVLRNHMAKPLAWRSGAREFEGVAWTVKNLFELKNARRVLVDGNVFEYNWPHAQNGFAILFTVRNQDGDSPWSTVEDVIFQNNLVQHVASGINILGTDDIHPSQPARRIAILNNLFIDVGGHWGAGRLFQLLEGVSDVRIGHNTALQTDTVIFGGERTPNEPFVFENNLVLHNRYGVIGSGTAAGRPTLDRYFPHAVMKAQRLRRRARSLLSDGQLLPVLDRLGRVRGSATRRLSTCGVEPVQARGLRRTGSGRRHHSRRAIDRVGTGQAVMQFAFWLALLLLGYLYAGYPLVAWFRARVSPQPHLREPIAPAVTVVVVAHNEGEKIAGRIQNLRALDYPANQLDIIIASDGSTDDTVARAREHADARVVVRAFSCRRGKAAVLNDIVRSARGRDRRAR